MEEYKNQFANPCVIESFLKNVLDRQRDNERWKERDRDLSPIGAQCLGWPGLDWGWSREEPGVQSMSPISVAGTQLLKPASLPSSVCFSRKLKSGAKGGHQTQEV